MTGRQRVPSCIPGYSLLSTLQVHLNMGSRERVRLQWNFGCVGEGSSSLVSHFLRLTQVPGR
jgi:hypothetical protein